MTVSARLPFFLLLICVSDVFGMRLSLEPYPTSGEVTKPSLMEKEYLARVRSMLGAFQNNMIKQQFGADLNALAHSKYRTWKRNADLINSMLALPKGMMDAGR